MSLARDTFVGEMLVERGVIEPDQLAELIAKRTEQGGGSIVEMLIASEAVDEAKVWAAVAGEMDLAYWEKIPVEDVDADLVTQIPISFAKANRLLPVAEEADGVKVACANPFELSALDAVQAIVGRPLIPVVAPAEAILEAINKVYERRSDGWSRVRLAP